MFNTINNHIKTQNQYYKNTPLNKNEKSEAEKLRNTSVRTKKVEKHINIDTNNNNKQITTIGNRQSNLRKRGKKNLRKKKNVIKPLEKQAHELLFPAACFPY